MTDQLRTLYRERAERADIRDQRELDVLLADAVERATERAHHRRAGIVTGTGVLAVAAATAVTLALTTGDGGSTSSPVAGPPTLGHTTAALRAPVSAGPAQKQAVAAASRAAVARAAAAEQARNTALEALAAAARSTLTPVAPAPAGAPLSLGLLPHGLQYQGSDPATVTYGHGSTTEQVPGNFVGKLVAMVSRPAAPEARSTFPLTVNGHPARYAVDSDGVQTVWLYVTDSIQVDLQFWSTIDVTEAQALAVAGSVTVRDTSHPAVG